MIHILREYYLKVSKTNVTVCKSKLKINKTTGAEETAYTSLGYYDTIENALNGVYKFLTKDSCSHEELQELSELITVMKDLRAEVVKININNTVE